MIKLFYWTTLVIGYAVMAVHINPESYEAPRSNPELSGSVPDDIAEPSNFLLAPEELDEAVNDMDSHMREKKSPWNNINQMYDMRTAGSDPSVQQYVARRNYYDYDQPEELARAERRYRTIEPNDDYYGTQRLAALRKQIEQEEQMYAARQRQLREVEQFNDDQNRFQMAENQPKGPEVGISYHDAMKLADSVLGSPQESTPEVGSIHQTYAYGQPAPYPYQAQSIYAPQIPPSIPFYPQHHHHQQQPSSCGKNLVIGCQPQVQHVPCSSSYGYEPQQPYPVQPYQYVQPLPLLPGLTSAHVNVENAPPAVESSGSVQTSTPTSALPHPNASKLNEPNPSASKTNELKLNPNAPRTSPPTDAAIVTVESSKHEPSPAKTNEDVEETSIAAKPIEPLKPSEANVQMDKARENFMEMIKAKKRAQEAEAQSQAPLAAKVVELQRPFDHRAFEHRSSDHHPSEHRSTDHSFEHRSSDHHPSEQRSPEHHHLSDHRPLDRSDDKHSSVVDASEINEGDRPSRTQYNHVMW